MRSLSLNTRSIDLHTPFTTAARSLTTYRAVLVEVREGDCIGRGEARGIPLNGETPESMITVLEAIRDKVEAGLGREELSTLLPIGGARNALDCALWDLECRLKGITLWDATGVKRGPVTTAFTISLAESDEMVRQALDNPVFTLLKIKIDGVDDIAKVAAVRAARPHARLIVDANQSLSAETLPVFARRLASLDVSVLEQPLPRGADEVLTTFKSPVPVCADESIWDRSGLPSIAGRYDMINIKLDKTGGLTEALHLLKEARAADLKIMIGNMLGTSLAMAPALPLARQADFVDLDGPLLLGKDPEQLLDYDGPYINAKF